MFCACSRLCERTDRAHPLVPHKNPAHPHTASKILTPTHCILACTPRGLHKYLSLTARNAMSVINVLVPACKLLPTAGTHMMNMVTNQLNNRTTDQTVDQPTKRPSIHPSIHLVIQPTNQTTKRPTNRSTTN